MERQPYFPRANYYASDQIQNQRIHESKETLMNESFNKRKSIEESDDYRNKRRCTNIWTASTSTSIQSNENVSYLETNWTYDQNILTNSLEKFHGTCTLDQLEHSYPHRFLSLMYQLELSVLCLLRKYALTNSTEPAIFKRSKNGQFNNIILSFKGEYFCIKVLHVDTYYVTKCLNFNSFFSHGSLTLTIYLNEFAIELLCYLDSVADAPKYLIIYTNCALDLTNDKKLYQTEAEECNFIQLSSVTSKTDPDLIDLLESRGEKNCEFYRFANDGRTRSQLSHLLKIKGNSKNEVNKKGASVEEIRDIFWQRLIFAVNQPTLEELVETVRTEVHKRNEDFTVIRKEVMDQLILDEEKENTTKLGNVQSTIYAFNLFLFCIHDMFLYENISAVKFVEVSSCNNVAMNSRNNFLYFRPLEIDIGKLSLNEFSNQKYSFLIDSLFSFFYLELNEDIEYFVIFTNASLTLVKELILGGDFDPNEKIETRENIANRLKFCRLNAMEEKYFMFRHSFLDANNLYQFSRGETRKIIMSYLTIPPGFHSSKFSHLNDNDVKELFMDKIVFAVRQYNSDEMYKVLEKDVDNCSRVPYDCKELHQVVLHYLKSHESAALTKDLMITLGDNLRNKKPYVENIQSTLFEEEIELAKRVIPLYTPEFGQFVNFLTRGEGKVCLDNLRRNGMKPTFMSSIIEGSGRKDVEKMFVELYNTLFDQGGNKTKILKIFEGYGFSVDNISNMLNGSGLVGPKTLVSLYELWFDNFGNPTNCLRNLQNEGINLSHISRFLSNTRTRSVHIFKTLYALWFHEDGTKTQCLKNLEQGGINLAIMFDVLHKSWQMFENLYELWFDKSGQKTMYLKKFEGVGINLNQICRVIKGSNGDAVTAFQKLYKLWFDSQGRKTLYLLTLENEGVNLAIIFDILLETGTDCAKSFRNLYYHWFNHNGQKTMYLKALEAKGRPLPVICRLLSGEGSLAAEKFKTLAHSLNSVDSPLDRLIKDMACKQEVQSQIMQESDSSPAPMNFEYKVSLENHQRGGNTNSLKVEQEINWGPQMNFEYQQRAGNANSVKIERAETKRGPPPNPEYQQTRGNFSTGKMQETNRGPPVNFEYQQRAGSANSIKFEGKETNRGPPPNPEYQQTRGNFSTGRITQEANRGSLLNPRYLQTKANSSKMTQDSNWGAETSQRDKTQLQKSDKISRNADIATIDITSGNESDNEMFENASDEERSMNSNDEYHRDFNDGEENEEEEEEDEGEEIEEVATTSQDEKTEREKSELKRKLICLFKLFPNWKRKRPALRFSKGSIRKLIPTINDPKALHKFVEAQLRKRKITEEESADILSIVRDCPFSVNALQRLLRNSKKLSNRETKYQTKFAEIVFDDENSPNFDELVNYLSHGEGKWYLNVLTRNNILSQDVARMFKGCHSANEVIRGFRALCGIWFDNSGHKSQCLQHFVKAKVNIRFFIFFLIGSGVHAVESFTSLYQMFFNPSGKKSQYLSAFEKSYVKFLLLCGVFKYSGAHASSAFEKLYHICFDQKGMKSRYVQKLAKEHINLSMVMRILKGTTVKARDVFEELYNLWFDFEGNKTPRVQNLEECGISLEQVATFLVGKGKKAPADFEILYNFVFDEMGHKRAHIINLEKSITLNRMFKILCGPATEVKCLKELYDLWFDSNGLKRKCLLVLEENGINLRFLADLFDGLGLYAYIIFNSIYSFFFDKNGKKNVHLTNLEQVMDLRTMLEIARGAKKKIFIIVRQLYNLFFDVQGKQSKKLVILEQNGITLMDVSKILSGSGSQAANKFKKIVQSVKRNNLTKADLVSFVF